MVDATVTPAPELRERHDRGMLASVAAASRFVASFVSRTHRGDGGLAELAAVVELQRQTQDAIDEMARHLLAVDDASYREIGVALGITPQAAAKRYPGLSSRPSGGQQSHLR